MTRGRLQLLVAAGLFAGWLGWLGYAVTRRGSVPLVSRAQVTGASHVVVAEVTLGPDELPSPTVKISEVFRGGVIKPGQTIEVINLPSARPPGGTGTGGARLYLLPLTGDGRTFRVAGLPRSPGVEPAEGVRGGHLPVDPGRANPGAQTRPVSRPEPARRRGVSVGEGDHRTRGRNFDLNRGRAVPKLLFPTPRTR